MLSIFINLLLILDVLVCLLLILLTLMQRPKNEGLGAAFGGGMTENLFGADTSNVLAKATRVLGGLFFVITLGVSILHTKQANSASAVQARLAKTAAAAAAAPAKAAASATATPAPSAAPVASATPAPTAAPSPAATPAK